MKKNIIIAASILLLIALLCGAVWSWLIGGLPAGSLLSAGAAQEVPPPVRAVPKGFKEYHNGTYHISLFYPDNFTVREFPELGGGMTITFEYLDDKIASGFQLFITPFAGGQITEDRFKEDIPSGVRENLKNIQVAGAVGASFFSTDKILGATYEAWFLHGGFLYEANTFKESQPMLDSIISSVLFY
jgi:hypothetical protein